MRDRRGFVGRSGGIAANARNEQQARVARDSALNRECRNQNQSRNLANVFTRLNRGGEFIGNAPGIAVPRERNDEASYGAHCAARDLLSQLFLRRKRLVKACPCSIE